jgi:hypothetical protein
MRIDPTKIHIGDIVLVNTRAKTTKWCQKKLGYGDSAKWTHVAGSIGGLDIVEGAMPQSKVDNIQTEYVDKGFEIKILRPDYTTDADRIKIALWWATMCNRKYDYVQLLWYPIAALVNKALMNGKNRLSTKKFLICSELIAEGLYKQGYALFAGRPANAIVPADYDVIGLIEVKDIWVNEK